jgi:LacI family transcriptional regulator
MQKLRPPTIKDVARVAGVSFQTVSNVINGEKRVSADTRARVNAAIRQLGYQPHAAARSLRSGSSKIIGLLIPDAHNPFFWQVVSGAEEEALAQGYSLLLATTGFNPARAALAFHALARQQLDGIIPLFTYPENFVEEMRTLQAQGVPSVVPGSTLSQAGVITDTVTLPYRQVAAELMVHLLALGHTRIALICGVGRGGLGRGRVSAYQEGLANANLPADPRYLHHCGNSLEEGFAAGATLLKLDPPPTAIIGINDLMAHGALMAAQRAGLRVPEDVSVAGFDDLPSSALLTPPLTSGRIEGAEVGQQCVRLLLNRLAAPDLPPQSAQVPARLVIRQSTGPVPPARSPNLHLGI